MEKVLSTLKRLRKDKGLTLLEVADKLGISLTGYQKIENGVVSMTLERAQEIADIFQVSLGALLGIDGATSYVDEKYAEELKAELAETQKRLLQIEQLAAYANESALRAKRELESLEAIFRKFAYYHGYLYNAQAQHDTSYEALAQFLKIINTHIDEVRAAEMMHELTQALGLLRISQS